MGRFNSWKQVNSCWWISCNQTPKIQQMTCLESLDMTEWSQWRSQKGATVVWVGEKRLDNLFQRCSRAIYIYIYICIGHAPVPYILPTFWFFNIQLYENEVEDKKPCIVSYLHPLATAPTHPSWLPSLPSLPLLFFSSALTPGCWESFTMRAHWLRMFCGIMSASGLVRVCVHAYFNLRDLHHSPLAVGKTSLMEHRQ